MRRTLAQIAGLDPAQTYRNGGHVRGPGTGTSDSIDIKASNGEFILPTDTVRKVGVRRLQDLVHDTHTPVKGEGKPGHFVGGGLVERVRRDSEAFAQQQAQGRAQARQAHESNLAVAQQADEEQQAGGPAPIGAAPPGASVRAPGLQGVADRVAQIPTDGYRPAPAADGSQSSWANTETGRNLSNIATALPGAMGGAIPAIAKTGGAISGGIDAATRLLNAGAGAAAISAIPGAASAQSMPTSSAGAGRGVVNPPSVNPALPPPASPPRTLAGIAGLTEPTSNVTRVGNSYSGTNVAGDITVNGRAAGGGFMNTGDTSTPRPAGDTMGQGGQPSTQGLGARERLMAAGTGQPVGGQIGQQNMVAADNLAARQEQGARGRLMALATGPGSGPVEPGSFTGGYSGVVGSTSTYGNMRGRSPEQSQRDAAVSASSIMNRPRWGGRGADRSPAMQEFQASLQQNSNIRQNEAAADIEGMRQTGYLQREGLQQAGETQRTGIRAQGVDDANQIGRGRLRLEQIAAGYTNRSADRIDRAQAAVEAATTPEARKSARERLMALAGGGQQNEWGLQVTPTTKNLDGSSTQGSVYRYNKATGETARMDQPGAAQPSANHAAALRANPKLAAQFDEIYGAGASGRALGGR